MPEKDTVTVNYIYDAGGAGRYIGGVTAQTMRTWRAPSRSERLCELLREVDSAARQLELRIEKAENSKYIRPRTPHTADQRADVARAELAKLGIEVPHP